MEKTRERTSPWLIFARVIFTIGLVCTILFIFGNSLKIAEVSSGASTKVQAHVQGALIAMGAPGLAGQISEHLIRKAAHLSEYMLEGFFLMLCLRVYTRKFFRHISWPLLGGLFTALVDESIQLFTPGRTAQITDIWIDFAGVVLGVLVALFLLCLCRMVYVLYKYRNEV